MSPTSIEYKIVHMDVEQNDSIPQGDVESKMPETFDANLNAMEVFHDNTSTMTPSEPVLLEQNQSSASKYVNVLLLQ